MCNQRLNSSLAASAVLYGCARRSRRTDNPVTSRMHILISGKTPLKEAINSHWSNALLPNSQITSVHTTASKSYLHATFVKGFSSPLNIRMVLSLSKQRPKVQYHSTRAGNKKILGRQGWLPGAGLSHSQPAITWSLLVHVDHTRMRPKSSKVL